ncbi:MAG: hypothetical protein K0V04_23605 [Deltaproteobacteria bacterium]|nr:hypothetical protein [Deltaproteobacteria bacterium]
MIRALRGARLDRFIERELTQGLAPRQRARLHDQLRRDADARARYDRAVAALRVFEGDAEFAPTELDLVGRWLVDDWGEQPEPEAERARWWVPALAAAAVAAAMVLWSGSLGTSAGLRPWTDDGWQARGADDDGRLAIEALCGPDEPDADSIEVRARDCGNRDLLGFAYRTEPGTEGMLTLFGIDADGDPMFYAPTPVDPSGVTVSAGHWRASSLAIRLSVNHAAGPLRIYGVVAPVAATEQEIRTWVGELSAQSEAETGDTAWTQRVPAGSLTRVCPSSTDCAAAELRLIVRP